MVFISYNDLFSPIGALDSKLFFIFAREKNKGTQTWLGGEIRPSTGAYQQHSSEVSQLRPWTCCWAPCFTRDVVMPRLLWLSPHYCDRHNLSQMSLLNKFLLVLVAFVWMLFRQEHKRPKPRANIELVQVELYRSHHHLQIVGWWMNGTGKQDGVNKIDS